MSRAGRRTKRLKRQTPSAKPTITVGQLLMSRLMNPDKRSHAEFVREMRDEQAARRLVNPATTALLLDRLEGSIRL